MESTAELPQDRALPGLMAIRRLGLARALPALGLGDGPVELWLCGYTAGERCTLEVRAGDRHLAVKAYAEDPSPEAALYEALATAGLAAEGAGARVPELLARDRDLHVLVIGWLEGPSASALVKAGRGARAGELGARWLQRAASLQVKLGPPRDAAGMLKRAHAWIAALESADPALGSASRALLGKLLLCRPPASVPRLVHGRLYARHVLDLRGGPGVIDWQRFGQGPLELDAAVFLATLWRSGHLHEDLAREAARAEAAFLAGTQGLLNERSLAWHRAAVLLHFAAKQCHQHGGAEWGWRARALLDEAARLDGIAR
jgi:hypothetical protein